MLRAFLAFAVDVTRRTFRSWSAHRSVEPAAALSFFGLVALFGAALAAVYGAGVWARNYAARSFAAGSTRHIAGTHNARLVDVILKEAASRHDGWIALAVGLIAFFVAILAITIELQHALDVIWEKPGGDDAKAAERHAPQFLAIFGLSLLLIVLLFAGAALHALTSQTHGLPAVRGMLYQALDVGASIVLLTFVFLCMFAYLPRADIPWRNVWLASFVSAVLYERGQFGLAYYFGSMDATSPYADAGALLAVALWLYYSAQVVLIGAELTKVLKERADERVSSVQ